MAKTGQRKCLCCKDLFADFADERGQLAHVLQLGCQQ